MLTLFFIAVILDRTNTPLRPIALAAGILILLKPESILDPSFQMSFAAVIALCAYFQEPPEATSLSNNLVYKSARHLWAVAMASVIAGAATAPFAFHHFGQYAVYGLFANMLVVPLTSFVIMPAGVVALLMMPFGLEHWPLVVMAEGIRGMMWVSDKTTALPFSTLNLPHMGMIPLILMVFGGLWICLWDARIRLAGIIPIFIGIILYSMQQLPNVVLDERGKLFAVRDPEIGMLVPARTYARYARQYWAKALGISAIVRFDELPAEHPLATCTEDACHWKIQGIRFFRGDTCEEADVLILTEPLECKGTLLTISPQDLVENGTYAIWVRHGKLRVESVEKPRGHRGWTMH
jgi:competence protein ComEC